MKLRVLKYLFLIIYNLPNYRVICLLLRDIVLSWVTRLNVDTLFNRLPRWSTLINMELAILLSPLPLSTQNSRRKKMKIFYQWRGMLMNGGMIQIIRVTRPG